MNDMTAVRRAADRLLAGALGPLLDLLAEDVEFEVASGGDVPSCRKDSGKQPVVDYFTALGGLMAFWQMDYTAMGQQLIAWGTESFTVEHCELEGGCEFALVFDLAEGMITRLLVIEDLASFVRGSDSLVDASTNAGSGGSTLGELAPYSEEHEPVLLRSKEGRPPQRNRAVSNSRVKLCRTVPGSSSAARNVTTHASAM